MEVQMAACAVTSERISRAAIVIDLGIHPASTMSSQRELPLPPIQRKQINAWQPKITKVPAISAKLTYQLQRWKKDDLFFSIFIAVGGWCCQYQNVAAHLGC